MNSLINTPTRSLSRYINVSDIKTSLAGTTRFISSTSRNLAWSERPYEPRKGGDFKKREPYQKAKSRAPKSDPATPVKRNRFALLDRPDVTAGHQRPSQRPFGVARQLQKKQEAGSLQEHIEMVKDTPLSSQNVVIWTLLFQRALEERRFNLAFELWNDMKKRGFMPNSRTFATFFSGCVDFDTLTPGQMAIIRSIWAEFLQHETKLRAARGEPYHPSANPAPYVPYLYLEMRDTSGENVMDIYKGMAKDGPFAPDKFVYTAFMVSLKRRTAYLEDGELVQDHREVYNRNSADIRRVFQDMIEASKSRPESVVIDSHALCALLRALVKGSKTDREYGVDVAAQLLGFSEPSAEIAHLRTIKPDFRTLAVLLELANSIEAYDLCIKYGRKAMESPKWRPVLDKAHMNHMLTAYGFLSQYTDRGITDSKAYARESVEILQWMLREAYSDIGDKIKPDRQTYNCALLTAWRCNDWDSAMSIFSVMTGLDHAEFDAYREASPVSSKPSHTIQDPDAQSMSYILRIALQDNQRVLKSLRIFQHYGFSSMLEAQEKPQASKDARIDAKSRQQSEDMAFYRSRLADGLWKGLSSLLGDRNVLLNRKERHQFQILQGQVRGRGGSPAPDASFPVGRRPRVQDSRSGSRNDWRPNTFPRGRRSNE